MLAFGALAVPLVNLTTSSAGVAPIAAAPKTTVAVEPVAAYLRLRFAHVPKTLSLKLDGRELCENISLTSSPVQIRANFPIPPEGIELILAAEWPGGTPDTAVTLEIEPDGLDTRTETSWSLGASMTEVISFQWK